MLRLPVRLVFFSLLGCSTQSSVEPPSAEPGALAPRPVEKGGVGAGVEGSKGSSGAGLWKAHAEAASGVHDAALRTLLETHWAYVLEQNPQRATQLGVHAYDHRLANESIAEELRDKARRREDFAAVTAIDPASLNAADRVTWQLFKGDLETDLATEVCELSHWNVTARGGAVGTMNRLPDLHRVDTVRDGNNLLARYRGLAMVIDHKIEKLRAGAAAGKFGNSESIRRAIEITHRQLDQPLQKWRLFEPGSVARPDWSAEEQAAFLAGLESVILDTVKPAVRRYVAVLEQELLPRARDDQHSGLASISDGVACYAALIRRYTTLPLSPHEIHELGLREMARINTEMRELGERIFGGGDLPQTLRRLRTDKALYFSTEQEVQQLAVDALAAAKEKMPLFFGRLPQADCQVVPIPELDAPYTTIAYYNGPFPDGSKPGEYFINTYAPATRPRYEARVLAYHESIPGHHLQISIAQELPEVPAFRKYGGETVFVEGWALYTERLADEMGLYTDDLDRMGVLSFDAWRAGRLVVDTGLHAKGWSRQAAIDYLSQNTALAANNIDNEVDRYISTPGQALAYKIGQLEILKLRAAAKESLGAKFDIRRFHDVVLGAGAVPLSTLRERVANYVQTGQT
ncbi:MAG: DUF885 domain-containing protein [Nannocystaceae bacterium]